MGASNVKRGSLMVVPFFFGKEGNINRCIEK